MTLQSRSGKPIGECGAPYVIAEIGTNHGRSIETARRLIWVASEAGCDCVKFQIYEPDEIVNPAIRAADYGLAGLYGDISARDMFERYLKTPKEWFPRLRDESRALGLDCCVTLHGEQGAEWARGIGFDVIKVASMDHTNLPLFESLKALLDAPILVSLGMAEWDDTDRTVAALRPHQAGFGLFHCVSVYPPEVSELALGRIATLRKRYQVPVGFSDHTTWLSPAVMAYGLGATFFEKHITLDRTTQGPDHPFAMEPRGLRRYVAAIRDSARARGKDDEAEIAGRERDNRRAYLKSVHLRRSLSAGAVLGVGDLICVRPGTGIAPRHKDALVGRKLARALGPDAPLQWSDLVPAL